MLSAKVSGCSANALVRMVLLPPPEGPLTIIGGIMNTVRQVLTDEYWQRVEVALGTRRMGVARRFATENTFLIITTVHNTQHVCQGIWGENPPAFN